MLLIVSFTLLFSVVVKQLNSFRPQCIFLHIEVTLVKATYCVSVSDVDPDIVPSPLRIDNLSSVPITFKQVWFELMPVPNIPVNLVKCCGVLLGSG